jgi:hypothetical protein
VFNRPSPVTASPTVMDTQCGHPRSLGHRDSFGGSLGRGFSPLPRVTVGEGGGNGGKCTRLQQGHGAPARVHVHPDARTDAMGPAASGCSEWQASRRFRSADRVLVGSLELRPRPAFRPCLRRLTVRPLLRLRLHLDLGCDLLDHMSAPVCGLLLRQACLLSTLS